MSNLTNYADRRALNKLAEEIDVGLSQKADLTGANFTGPITATNLSGTNTGDQTTIVGITGTKSEFNLALTDGNFAFVGDALAADSIDNTLLANMMQATIKGRASGAGTGDPTDLSASQVLTILGGTTGTNAIMRASSPTTTGTLSAEAITASGQVTTAGYRDNGGLVARFEGTGGGIPSGSTGPGVEIYQTGGVPYIQFYNRSTSALIPGILETGGLTIQVGGGPRVAINSTGIDVVGEVRCDTVRVDATPTAAAVTQTHHIPVNINGTTYKLLLAS